MKHYDRILSAVYATPWAVQPEKLEAMIGFLSLKAMGQAADPDTVARIHAASEVQAARQRAAAAGGGSVAVIPIYGMLMHRANLMSDISGPRGTSVEQLKSQFQAALADPNVSAIVFDVDSPGGSVEGIDELATEIYDARSAKPSTAVVNCLAASAAYYLACSCSEIVASPSSATGSIGVYAAHNDVSQAMEKEGVRTTLISAGKYKVEGNSLEPLGDGARAAMQAMVDDYYGMFVKAVARGRKTTQQAVREGYGEGRVVGSAQAVKVGLVDRVGTLDSVLSSFGAKRGTQVRTRAESDTAAIAAQRQRMRLALA